MAYLLDPWYLGVGLPQNQRLQWEEEIFNYSKLLKNTVGKEYTQTLQKELLVDEYNAFWYFILEQRSRKNMFFSLKSVMENKIGIHKF